MLITSRDDEGEIGVGRIRQWCDKFKRVNSDEDPLLSPPVYIRLNFLFHGTRLSSTLREQTTFSSRPLTDFAGASWTLTPY